jgi:hypothetical protein
MEYPNWMIKSNAEAIANCIKKLIFKPRKYWQIKGLCARKEVLNEPF